MKSTGVAYLLWFFLGGTGAHRFYLGRVGSGLVYLMLFVLVILTGGLAAIVTVPWLLLDLFLIPGMVTTCNAQFGASAQATTNTVVNVNVVGGEEK